MKPFKIIALFLVLVTMSCSKSSSDEDEKVENSIIGYWVMTDFIVDENAAIDIRTDAELLRQSLSSLNCNMITMDIRVNKTIVIQVFDVEEVFVSADPNAPSYTCVNLEEVSLTWSFDNNLLTFTNSSGMFNASTVRFVGSTEVFVSSENIFGELGEGASELLFEKLQEI